MKDDLGTLGNVEIYFFLSERSINYYDCLEMALQIKPNIVLRNDWNNDVIGQSISFDSSLLETAMDKTEEILLQYFYGLNLISVI